MQLKSIFLVFILFNFLPLGSSAQTKKEKRQPTSFADDLKAVTGSYNLEKGKGSECPSGEFTGREDSFIIGADFKIEAINKGTQKSDKTQAGSCRSSSQAEFDGKTLTYLQKETCDGKIVRSSEHKFQFYNTTKNQYVKLNFNSTFQQSDTKTAKNTFECIYSRPR